MDGIDANSSGVYGINSAPAHEDHRRFRHVFAPAFSERALKRQEPIFQKNTDLMISTLSQAAVLRQSVNMVEMYQFTTFDIMGHLTFGEPLGLLQSNTYSKWVEAVFDSIKVIPIAQIIQYYPVLDFLFKALEPQSIKQMKYNHFKHSADRVDRRLKNGSNEADIWSMVLNANSDQRLSLQEMHCHGDVFMLAGSETTGILPISAFSVINLLIVCQYRHGALRVDILSSQKSGEASPAGERDSNCFPKREPDQHARHRRAPILECL